MLQLTDDQRAYIKSELNFIKGLTDLSAPYARVSRDIINSSASALVRYLDELESYSSHRSEGEVIQAVAQSIFDRLRDFSTVEHAIQIMTDYLNDQPNLQRLQNPSDYELSIYAVSHALNPQKTT